MRATSRKGRPIGLQPPRRNRYFDGKVLMAADLTLEQDYWLARERQLNLHVFGYGVVSGLGVAAVQTGDDWGIRISPGLAIDGWGRLVVVPDEHELVPLELTDEKGDPIVRRSKARPRRLIVSLCYREYSADFVPAASAEEQEAATWVETYAIRVRKGRAESAAVARVDEALDALRVGRLHDAVCALGDAVDPRLPEDPCIVLANVSAAANDALDVDQCTPRPIVPTNRLLLALVGALAERIEKPLSP